MNKESMKEKIKQLTVTNYPSGLRLNLDDFNSKVESVKLSLHPVLMAIHLELYKEACDLMNSIDGVTAPDILTGRISGSKPGNEQSIGLGEILIAHDNIPADLLEILYDKWPDSADGILDYFDTCFQNQYVSAYNKEGYYRRIAMGIGNVNRHCPQMLRGIMKKSLYQRDGMPVPENAIEANRNSIMDYILYLRIMLDALKPFPEDQSAFMENTVWQIRVLKEKDYITYEKQYGIYIEMLTNRRNFIEESKENVRPYNYCTLLLTVIADLYVISTNRFKKYSQEVRAITFKWMIRLGMAFHDASGDDPWWIFDNVDESSKPLVTHVWAMTPLFKYACGYKLKYDTDFVTIWEVLDKMFATLNHFGEWNKEARLPEAVESMEMFEPFEKISDPGKISKEVLTMIDSITSHVLLSDNEEVLEVCLRKKVIPPFMYDHAIESAQKEHVNLLPPLLAYREANRKERSYERVS